MARAAARVCGSSPCRRRRAGAGTAPPPTPISASTVASTAKWMRGAIPAPAASAAEPCPDEAACRERRVEGGEDRAPREPLERQSLGIRGHIDRAEGRPEAEQRSREGRESSRERGGDQGARSEQQARKRHAPAPDALAQAAGKRHRRERAEGGREQRQPEACVRQRGVMLHGRDPTSPGAEHQPVAEEVQPDREAFRAHQASTTSTPRAR